MTESSLAGKRVLLARAEGQNEAAARLLRERGAAPVVIPSIAIGPPDDASAMTEALGRLEAFDWVVFTSANGFSRVWDACAFDSANDLTRPFAGVRIAVVGKATREVLEARGVPVALQAKEFRGAALAQAILEASVVRASPPRVLLLVAQDASDVLPTDLRAGGALVTVVAVYRTRPSLEGAAAIRERVYARGLDAVIFSSGSMVDSLCDGLGASAAAALAPLTVACIGPVTVAAAHARGVRVDVVPRAATFPEVIAALEDYFRAI